MRQSLKVLPLITLIACSSVFAAPIGRRAGPRIVRHVRNLPPPPPTLPQPGGGQSSGMPEAPSDLLRSSGTHSDTWRGDERSPRVTADTPTPRTPATRLGGINAPRSAYQRPPVSVRRNTNGSFSVGFASGSGLQAEGGYTFRLR